MMGASQRVHLRGLLAIQDIPKGPNIAAWSPVAFPAPQEPSLAIVPYPSLFAPFFAQQGNNGRAGRGSQILDVLLQMPSSLPPQIIPPAPPSIGSDERRHFKYNFGRRPR